jgi:hypothetical protein
VGRQQAGHPGKPCIRFSIGLRTPGSGVPHIVRVVPQRFWNFRIARVSGVDFEGETPGAEVRLLDNGKSTGTMEVELEPTSFLSDPFDWGEPPLVEVTGANERLLGLFRDDRMVMW